MDNYNRDYRTSSRTDSTSGNDLAREFDRMSQGYGTTTAPRTGTRTVSSAFASLMQKVYLWMTLALAVSGLTAYYVASSPNLLYAIYSNTLLFWGLFIVEIGLVVWLTAAFNKISFTTATLLFLAYAILNGVTLSFIFIAYTAESITQTFLVTAGTFAAMAFIGSVTKKDLTKLGGILLMALIGLIIAGIVNMFLKSGPVAMVISAIGVLVFVGLTAYDAQKIKQMMLQCGDSVNDLTQKIAVLGALTLYLDFINLFLYLLRFLGKSRN